MIEKYIQMAVRDKRPENYKPRQGKVNGNLERYSGSLLEDLFNRANDTIIHLGYADVFKKTDKEAATRKWWKNSNRLIQVNSTNFVNDHNLNAEEKQVRINNGRIEQKQLTVNRLGDIRNLLGKQKGVPVRQHTRPWTKRINKEIGKFEPVDKNKIQEKDEL